MKVRLIALFKYLQLTFVLAKERITSVRALSWNVQAIHEDLFSYSPECQTSLVGRAVDQIHNE